MTLDKNNFADNSNNFFIEYLFAECNIGFYWCHEQKGKESGSRAMEL
jgi:hypothetical protein